MGSLNISPDVCIGLRKFWPGECADQVEPLQVVRYGHNEYYPLHGAYYGNYIIMNMDKYGLFGFFLKMC